MSNLYWPVQSISMETGIKAYLKRNPHKEIHEIGIDLTKGYFGNDLYGSATSMEILRDIKKDIPTINVFGAWTNIRLKEGVVCK